MRNSIISLTLLTACTSTPIGLDDEAGVTTAMDDSNESSGGTTDESGSTTETESTTSDDASSMPFVVDYDVMNPDECDSFTQDCPPGEKCVPYSSSGGNWDANKCVPVMGDQQVGEVCTWGGIVEATDDCDASSVCWDVMDVEGLGTCRAFCEGTANAPMCPPESDCVISGPIAICIPSCDPLIQDCNEGFGCVWANTMFECIFTTADIPTGEPCGFINDCVPGDFCADAAALPSCNGSACCSAYCDLQLGDAGCVAQPGTVCTTFFEQGTAPPGYENVGLCILPP